MGADLGGPKELSIRRESRFRGLYIYIYYIYIYICYIHIYIIYVIYMFGGCLAHYKALGVSSAVYASNGIIQPSLMARCVRFGLSPNFF